MTAVPPSILLSLFLAGCAGAAGRPAPTRILRRAEHVPRGRFPTRFPDPRAGRRRGGAGVREGPARRAG